MPRSRSQRALIAAAALAGSASGCSLLLDWSPGAHRPCGTDQSCLSGYSCLVNTCVADASVSPGDTCTRDEQCETALVCTPRPSVCRRPCDAYYGTSGSCDAGTYCRPSTNPTTHETRGSCVDSECSTNDDCDEGAVCVRIDGSAGACLRPCSPSLASGYSDGCTAPSDAPQPYCEPLGVPTPALVCLEQSAVTHADFGSPCDLGAQTCGRHAACIGGECHPYCDPVTSQPCAGTETCQATADTAGAPVCWRAGA